LGIFPKSSGTTLVFHLQSTSESGDLVNEQYMTTFLPRVKWPDPVGQPPPGHKISDEVRKAAPVASVVQRFDEDQTFRYAEASGDPSRWHLDNEYARAAGLSGIIIHGLCAMAFLGRAVAETAPGGDLLRLRRLAVRFSHPIYPGSAMTTLVWAGGADQDGTRLFFETLGPDEKKVVTNGLAVLAPAL
jgi:acyl dehydratase